MGRGWTASLNRVVKESLTRGVIVGVGRAMCPYGGRASRQRMASAKAQGSQCVCNTAKQPVGLEGNGLPWKEASEIQMGSRMAGWVRWWLSVITVDHDNC